jgi:hypothetical protein
VLEKFDGQRGAFSVDFPKAAEFTDESCFIHCDE